MATLFIETLKHLLKHCIRGIIDQMNRFKIQMSVSYTNPQK